jgi:hypothetical protein
MRDTLRGEIVPRLTAMYYDARIAMGKRTRERQPAMWVTTTELPTAASHPFYRRLNQLLSEHGFDEFVEAQCAEFYAQTIGRPGLPPGIYFRLLESVAGLCVDGLRLHDRYRKITSVPEEVVQTFLRAPFHPAAGDNNPAIRKTLLFAYLFVVPARGIKLRQDVPPAGVRFGEKSHFV